MSIKFSIVIPAHNEEGYLAKTLHSLKQQTYQDFETIIVTNGCTDKTYEIASNKTNDRIKHLDINVASVSRARNYGASKAEGEVLVFLDADTTLETDALQKINQQFSEKHSVASTLSKPDRSTMWFNFLAGYKNFNFTTGIYKGCSGALVCRREDFDKVNGYDPELKVREHRKLIQKLLEHGTYGVVKTPVTTSMRRMQKWGLLKASAFWTKQWVKDKFGNLKDSEYEKIR